MPSLNLAIPHSLTQEEAIARLQRHIEMAKQMYGAHVSNLNEQWSGNVLNYGFSAMGMATSGTLRVEEGVVQIDSKLPLAAVMFRGRIEDTVRNQLGQILA
jgi:hypothetical protein